MTLQVQLLRDSFELAKPIADQISQKFYELLFQDYPQAQGLFQQVDMEKQQKALIRSLVFIVDNLENSDRLVAFLQGMGQRHGKYGVEDEHFEWVGTTLLKTFAYFFKDKWTDDLQQAWADAYGVIANTMKDSIHAQNNDSPSSEETVVQSESNNVVRLETGNRPVSFQLPETLIKTIEDEVDRLIDAKIDEEINRVIQSRLNNIDNSSILDRVKKAV